MINLNATHGARLKSWVESANNPVCDFSVQNLPYGVFSTAIDPRPRVGVAIGDQVLDLAKLEASGLLATGFEVFGESSLNAFMQLGRDAWSQTRSRLSELLRADSPTLRDLPTVRADVLSPAREATLHRPVEFKGFTDFYASREHATNIGSMFRDPAKPLLPNWLHIPIAYNGRTSTVVVSGTSVRRPLGQIKPPDAENPILSACRKLDFELEIGAVLGCGSPMGEILTVRQAHEMIFGYVLLNDWSARDIQQWEYVPLGPFQAKVFATSISPWIVTAEALEPFRVMGPEQVPAPLDYLRQDGPYNFDIHLEVAIRPEGSSVPTTVCRTNFKFMYWSSIQQLVHHAICGCAMQVGDLLGSGTISAASKGSFGSLLELAWNGQRPLSLKGGGSRTFLEDGDEVIITGWGDNGEYRVGFGEVRGKISPAFQQAMSACPIERSAGKAVQN